MRALTIIAFVLWLVTPAVADDVWRVRTDEAVAKQGGLTVHVSQTFYSNNTVITRLFDGTKVVNIPTDAFIVASGYYAVLKHEGTTVMWTLPAKSALLVETTLVEVTTIGSSKYRLIEQGSKSGATATGTINGIAITTGDASLTTRITTDRTQL